MSPTRNQPRRRAAVTPPSRDFRFSGSRQGVNRPGAFTSVSESVSDFPHSRHGSAGLNPRMMLAFAGLGRRLNRYLGGGPILLKGGRA